MVSFEFKEKFVKKTLSKYLDLAEIKALCLSYKFNNQKLQKIAK